MSPDFLPDLGPILRRFRIWIWGPSDRPIRQIILRLFVTSIVILLGFFTFGAFIRASFTVVEPCQREKNGEIIVSASTGFDPLTFTWSSTDKSWTPNPSGDPIQKNLPRATFKVVITNKLGNTKTLIITLHGLEDATLDATPPTGFVTADGSINVNVTPPGEACKFAWSDGPTTKDRSGLDAGIYMVTVTDSLNPSCILGRTQKLLPAYSTPCVDWEATSPRVLSIVPWTRVNGLTGQFENKNKVQSLLSSTFGSLSLKGCSNVIFLEYTQAVPLLEYLSRHNGTSTPGKWTYIGPILNPASTSLPINDIAAELLTATLNIRNVNNQSPPPAVRMEDAVYLGNPYYGYTVRRIVRMAERALDCGKDESDHDMGSQDFVDLYQTLNKINQSGLYLACPLCSIVFFERVGDLPGEGIEGLMNDISADGQRGVGYSAADDSLVSNDGAGACLHGIQAIGYIRPCSSERFFPLNQLAKPGFPPGNGGLGLIGLGYLPAETHAESNANGISPDGTIVVGYASTTGSGCGLSRAVVFKGATVFELQAPANLISWAHDVTNAAVVAGPTSVDGPFGHSKRIAVGYITTGSSHAAKTPGAKAVYWDPSGVPHDLPLPSTLPGGQTILSSEATTVSDDGSVIAGNLYYVVGDYPDQEALACVWTASAGGYGPPLVLQDPAGGQIDARVKQVSGDGKVIVGFGWDATDEKAIRWRRPGSSWTVTPDLLPMITGGELSFAMGVNYDGSVIVGSCDTSDFGTHFAARWTGNTVQDVLVLLNAVTPPLSIPTDWQLQASRVSADGKTMVGVGYDASFQQEGWIARIP